MNITQFLLTGIIAFIVLAGIGLFLDFCRRRLRKTGHGLTGMCHKNGGTICTTCADSSRKKKKDT